MGETAAGDLRESPPSVADSLREYGRGFAGGLLFSLPLLYTMEVWWTAFIAEPFRLLLLLVFTFVLLLGYNRYAGLRHDASWVEVAIDSVEELGLGIVTSAGVLYLIGRIGPSTSRSEMLGKIVVEAAIVAVGFSVGSAQLGSGGRDSGKGGEGAEDAPGMTHQIAIGFCGAVLFAANVAPTEEILVIGAESELGRLVGIAALSIALVGGVLHFIAFKGSDRYAPAESNLDVMMGTAVTYAIALVASAMLLWFFGRFEGTGAGVCVSEVVVLGFPAALGAAAGRLLLQR